MNLLYDYNDRSIIRIPYLFAGVIALTFLVFSKFFLFGIIMCLFFYFTNRKKYYKFRVYDEFIEIRNFFSKKSLLKKDFKLAFINSGAENFFNEKTIIIKTKDNCALFVVPKNKAEGLKIVKVLEEFGIIFRKNELYENLIEWSVYRSGEQGAW